MKRGDIEKLVTGTSFKVPYGKNWLPQSMALAKSSNIIVACSGNNPNYFLKFNLNTPKEYKKIKSKVNVKHASGSTYCRKNKLIYVSDAGIVKALDPETLKVKFIIEVSGGATGIAYDRITNMFYTSSQATSTSATIRVWPFESFSKGRSVKLSECKYTFKLGARSVQDICGYNGIVMATTARGGTKRGETVYIDCYDAKTGNLLYSYSAVGEVESMAIDANGYIYYLAVKPRRLIKTKNQFNLKGLLAE